jgi:hypothetical protein
MSMSSSSHRSRTSSWPTGRSSSHLRRSPGSARNGARCQQCQPWRIGYCTKLLKLEPPEFEKPSLLRANIIDSSIWQVSLSIKYKIKKQEFSGIQSWKLGGRQIGSTQQHRITLAQPNIFQPKSHGIKCSASYHFKCRMDHFTSSNPRSSFSSGSSFRASTACSVIFWYS